MTTETKTLPVQTRARAFRWRRFLIVFGVILLALVIVAAIGTFVYASGNQGRILPGVNIASVNVAGLTPEEARAKLLATLPDVSAGALTVQAGSVEETIPYADIHRAYNLDATIEQAMQVGRNGNPIDQLGEQIRTMTGGVTLTPSVSYDAQALQHNVEQIVATAQVTPVDAIILFQNGAYVVTPAADGQQVNADEVLRQAIAALNTDGIADTSVNVPATSVSAGISTPDAQAAVTKFEAVASEPLVLTVGSSSHTIDPATLRGWVHLDETAPGQWSVVLDRAPIDQLVAVLKTQTDQPAVEAQFKFDNGQALAVPGATGYEVDATGSADAIYNALLGRANGTPSAQLTLAVTATVPDFTTEEAQSLVARVKLIGSWTTHYVPSPLNNGGQNIRRPAELINGTVVQPGAEFSFVGVAGPITTANGYGSGAAIIHGKTKAEGVLGGGLCSASTTAFNAALRAGFELGARRNHAYYISRYPVGLDATIWISGNYTQDMSFTNDSQYPIVIRGINKKRTVTFEIWGVPDGRTVSLSDPKIGNKTAASEVYEFTDSLAPRQTKVSEYKADGFNSVVVRTVRDANGVIIHQDTITSSYRRVNGVILVGRYPGDPPAGYQWPVGQGIPSAPGPKPTPTPTPTNPGKTPTPTPPPADSAPTAKFALTAPNSKGKVFFTDYSKGGPTSWSWDFGDGSSSSKRESVTHLFDRWRFQGGAHRRQRERVGQRDEDRDYQWRRDADALGHSDRDDDAKDAVAARLRRTMHGTMADEMRSQIVLLLSGRQAHTTFEEAVADFPEWAINERAPNVEYTPWHLVEHLRRTQLDMLRYIEDPTGYVSPPFPIGLWPGKDETTDMAGFQDSVEGFRADRRAMEAIALDEKRDLSAVLEGTPGHTPLRGLLIIGNHNSYHVGEFASLRQVMGSWPPGHN